MQMNCERNVKRRRSIHQMLVVAAAATAPFAPVSAATYAQTNSISSHAYAAHVAQASQRFRIPESWIWAVMRVESGGNPRALSRAGAMGLMQIMPATWAMLTKRLDLGSDPFDARANIHAGAAYLRLMWDRYGRVGAMLAAYNAGPRRADAWVARGGPLPAETASYVARIAPSIGGSDTIPHVADIVDALGSWRKASVFAARADSDLERDRVAADRPIAPVSADNGNTGTPVVPRSSTSLFVSLSGARP